MSYYDDERGGIVKQHICFSWNRPVGIENALDRKKRQRLLSSFGFITRERHENRSRRYLQYYEAYFFGMHALALFRNGIAIEIDPSDKLQASMLREAARAAYCLGLDAACVRFQYLGQRKIIINDIDPSPATTQTLLQQYKREKLDQLQRRKNNQRNCYQPLIGTDVEFLICSCHGRLIPAERLLPLQGRAGSDAVYFRDRILYPIAEIRPEPADDPQHLFRHFVHALRLADEHMSRGDYIWLAGAMPKRGFSLGGHLHFSNLAFDIEFLRVLDNYLLLPLTMLESPSSRQRRFRYGNPGDVRMKPYGLEYRSLPSWLVSPEVTKGVLALTFLLTAHYLELQRRPLLTVGVASAFANGDKKKLGTVCTSLLEDVTRTKTYPSMKHMLEPIMQKIRNGIDWQEQQDIRIRWTPYLLHS